MITRTSSSEPVEFNVGNGYWLSLSKQQQAAILRPYFKRALTVIAECSSVVPGPEALQSMVEAAFLAFSFYISVGLEFSGPESFGQFFDRYVVLSIGQLSELGTSSVVGNTVVLASSPEKCHVN